MVLACQPKLATRSARERRVVRPAGLEPATPGLGNRLAQACPGPPKTIPPDFTGVFEGGRQLLPTPHRDGVSHLCHTTAASISGRLTSECWEVGMFDFDLATATRATTSGMDTPDRGGRGGSDDRDQMADGASPRFDRATGMTTMAGRSVVVRAVIGKPLMSTGGIVVMMLAGRNATATTASATRPARRLHAPSEPAARPGARDRSRSRPRVHACAARSRARSRPSARFEWSPVVTFATTTIVRPIRAQATCGICASKGWSRPFGCPATASMRSR